ncbi:beta-ketoacyl-[acyl-carrier-protein] synthase II, partial [Bacillus licheniformis]
QRVFGEGYRNVSVSSSKSQSGHLLGASGALESIITLLALEEGLLPAIVNYEKPDPECDLNLVTGTPQERNIRYALKSSLGFGGHNAALVYGKWEGV